MQIVVSLRTEIEIGVSVGSRKSQKDDSIRGWIKVEEKERWVLGSKNYSGDRPNQDTRHSTTVPEGEESQVREKEGEHLTSLLSHATLTLAVYGVTTLAGYYLLGAFGGDQL